VRAGAADDQIGGVSDTGSGEFGQNGFGHASTDRQREFCGGLKP
jgi:hypothetical protein